MNATQLRPRTFGEILDGAFQIFRRHFITLGVTTLLPSAISAVATIGLLGASARGELSAAAAIGMGLAWLVIVPATIVVWGALAWQTSEAWMGGDVAVSDGYRAGLRSFWRLVGGGIVGYVLLWVGMMVVLVPIGIVAAIGVPLMAAGGDAAGAVVGGVMMVGVFVAMVLAGVLGGGALVYMLPAIVVEGLGPFRAVSRSWELARGALLRGGGLVMVAMLIAFLPMVAVMLLTGQFTGMFDPSAAPPSLGALVVQQLGMLAVGAFTTPFLVAAITVLYYDRRVRAEAFDVHRAAGDLSLPDPLASTPETFA